MSYTFGKSGSVRGNVYERSIVELIKTRRSCRSFDGRPLTPEVRGALAKWLRESKAGPFGNEVRLALVELGPRQRLSSRLGTYGVIKGARAFLAGAVRHGEMHLEDFGFVFESAILKATELGLGTCWLGGTFSRSVFARALDLAEEELLPAVSPVGYAKGRATLIDKAFRAVARSATRKTWAELFFSVATRKPICPQEVGVYAQPLEMLRLAPSASNRQPWRVLWEPAQRRFHFVLCRTKGYRLPGAIDLQRVDMGIAMCHFALTAMEAGLSGRWVRERAAPGDVLADSEYCATWQAVETAHLPGECKNVDSRA